MDRDALKDPFRTFAALTGHYSAIHDVRVGDHGGRDGRGRLVRIYSNGTGSPVLAVPDLGSSAAAWLPLTERLCAAGRQLVAVDLPGSGHCDPLDDAGPHGHTDHLAAVVEQLAGPGGSRSSPSTPGRPETGCDVMGVGFGAFVVLSLAARRPDLVARVVALDPLLPPPDGAAPRPRMSLGMALDGAVTTLRRGRLTANLGGLGRARAVLGSLAHPDPAWWAGLSGVAAPTLLIASGRADEDGRTVLETAAAAIPGARRADLPPGTAGPHRDPEPFADLLLPFLAG